MVQIGGGLNMGRALFSSDGESINGGVTVENLQDIAKTIAKDYEGQQINVKNVFDVMRQVFEALDAKSSTLEESRRKDIGSGIIHHILTLNRNTETQAFADRALDLLVEYSIDAVAADTLKPAEQPATEKSDSPIDSNIVEDEQPALISEQVQHEDSVSRSRLEEVTAPLVEGTDSIKKDIELDLATPSEPLDGITIPSKAATIALSKAATQNSDVIDKEVNEAAQYVRSVSIEVDNKMAQVQDKIHDCIDHAFGRVGVVCDKLVGVLEGAHELSADTKGQIIDIVNEFAEKLIDAVVAAKSELMLEEDSPEKSLSPVLPFSDASVELPIQEIMANP